MSVRACSRRYYRTFLGGFIAIRSLSTIEGDCLVRR